MPNAYMIVLRILVDDEDDDPRYWPFDELLAPPEGEPERHVSYVDGVKIDRD